MELKKGQIVTSRLGRDITRSYVVVGFEKGSVLLANGLKFTLLAPKKKNPRHLVATKIVLEETQTAEDAKIIRALQGFDALRAPDMPGG